MNGQEGQPSRHHQHQHHADHRPHQRANAANDHHRQHQHRVIQREALHVDERFLEGEQRARHPGEGAADGDGQGLEHGHVLAERAGGALAIPQRHQRAAEAAAHQQPDGDQGGRQTPWRRRRGRPGRKTRRSRTAWGWDAHQAADASVSGSASVKTVLASICRPRLAATKYSPRTRKAGSPRHSENAVVTAAAATQATRDVRCELQGDLCPGIGAQPEEHGMGHAEDAGIADHHVQADRQDAEDRRQGREVDQISGHRAIARPNMPLGRKRMKPNSSTKPAASLHSVSSTDTTTLSVTRPAARRPPRRRAGCQCRPRWRRPG